MVNNLERFTPFARVVFEVADKVAETANHQLIDPAHLWTGLWVVEGAASSILRKLEGMSYPDLQNLIVSKLQDVVLWTAEKNIPRQLTEGSKAVLEYAVERARDAHHASIGTGHLLLGLLDLHDSITDAILNRITISPRELNRRMEIAIENYVDSGDRVEINVAPSGENISCSARIMQWFGKPPPRRPKRPTPNAEIMPRLPISIEFLRENAYDISVLWLLAFAAQKYEEAQDEVALAACYSLILRACPPDSYRVPVVMNRGIAYLHLNDLDSALEEFNRAIPLAPDNPLGYLNRGVAWHRKEQYDKAIEDETRALDLIPTNPIALLNRALSYQRDDQLDLALVDFNAILRVKPDDLGGLLYRGLLYRELGDRDGAFNDFAAAQRIAPHDVRIYRFRAYLHADVHDFEQAHRELETALTLKPNDRHVLRNRAYVYKQQEDYAQAIVEYTRLIERYPDDHFLYVDRASTYIELGEYYRAAVDLHNARQLKPAEGLPTEAWLHLKRGENDAAIQTAAKVIEKHPTWWGVYFTTASAYDAKGNTQEALHYFNLALERWPAYCRTNLDKYYRQATDYVAMHEADASNPDSASDPADPATPQP
ncbi:MAG: tetratricopeptide repeat protein [Anaerolineae bacterium]|nr:tetratricopeptide repeat protein [Anaerolineae bacterium]